MPVTMVRLGHMPNCSSLGNVLNVLVLTQAAAAVLWVAAERWEARRRRPEPGGGETRAIDHPAGIVQIDTVGPPAGPTEAHVQITRACSLPCPSCHIEPTVDGVHVPVETVEARLAQLATDGVLHVALGGGEPTRHPALPRIAATARRLGLSVGLTTAGVAVDPAVLGGFDQVNVSLDGLGEVYRTARGYAGAPAALETISRLAAQGTRVGVNIVLDRQTWAHLDETVAAAVSAGAQDIQLLRLKPVGRAQADYLDRRLTPAEGRAFWSRVSALITRWPAVTFRADCALVPFLASAGVDPTRMRDFGILGCHGGDWLASVGVDGTRAACSFVPETPSTAWRVGVQHGACATCAWQPTCRGGCHAVARHLTGELFQPDPECPRVLDA